MVTDLSSGVPKVAKNVLQGLKIAYESVQQAKVDEFLKMVAVQYELMTSKQQDKLNEVIDSYDGRVILSKYAEAVMKTDSRIARMALALLYCEDPDFVFDASEKIVLVKAIRELDDHLLDFFLVACKQNIQTDNLPYPRAHFGHDTSTVLDKKGWDQETVFVFVNELIRIRLLLPDPMTSAAFASVQNHTWAVWFGVTHRSKKMSRLFLKARELVNQPEYKVELKSQDYSK